jgi:drug/metabolite transporter (DMT)-like permease
VESGRLTTPRRYVNRYGMTMTTVGAQLERRALLLNGVGVILVASILFGTMAVFVRAASQQMASTQIAFVRFAGSLLVLLLFTRGRGLLPRPGNLRRVVLRSVLGASAIVLYFRGIEGAGAGLATLLNCTYPVFTALFATLVMGERFHARLACALALNLVGLVIVLNPVVAMSGPVLWGGLSALAAAVFAGGAVATARQLRASETALLITTYFMAVGAVLTAPALLLGLPPLSAGLLLVLAGVVLSSVAGQLLLHQGLGFAPATQGSLAAAISVVTAAVLSALWLGEQLSQQSLLGACFMLAAVGLAAAGSE